MTNRRILLVLAGAVFLVGAVAVVSRLLAPARVAPYVEPLDVAPPPEPPRVERPRLEPRESGGTYGGVVVDARGQPVRDADVLLVGIDENAKVTIENADAQGPTQSFDLPKFGEHRTVGRTKTGPDGRFSLSAGSARIVALVAHERAYSPAILAHTMEVPLQPRPDLVLVLAPAGHLHGQVLDATTKAPVPGADVTIYFQQPSNQAHAGPEKITPTNAFGMFQTYVERQLGPIVWGIASPPGDSGFHLTTSADGRFAFGPVMQEAQVEVIVTHPEYMWTDSDPEVAFPKDNPDPSKTVITRRRRTVVPPGETVERTYYLQRGNEVRGRVVDAADQPIEHVQIALEHISQYAQHWRYRVSARAGRTDGEGRFRIAGLAQPPYNLRMTHPSFDTEWFSGVKESPPSIDRVVTGADPVYKIQAGGWLELKVEDGPSGQAQWSARAMIESADRRSTVRQEAVLVRDGTATIERLKPGRYAITLISGTSISTTAQVEVRSGDATKETVRMEAGGGIRIPVRDGAGKAVDPATVQLDLVDGDGGAGRRATVLVSREGVVASDGLLAGRYVARAQAPGYVPASTEVFDVAASRTTTLPALVLRRQAYVRVTGVVDEAGHPVAVDTALFVGESGAEPERRRTQQTGLLPVAPGCRCVLRAETADGRRYEKTLDVPEGATLPVEIRLSR